MLGPFILCALLGFAPPPGDAGPPEGPQPPAPKLDSLPAQPESSPSEAVEREPPPESSPEAEPPESSPESGTPEQAPPDPEGTRPPGEGPGEGPAVPEFNEDEAADAEALEAALTNVQDRPYFATAARKSALRRNNEVLVRPFRKPVYSVAAAARLGAMIGGQQVVQPIGWGVAMQLRLHFLRVVKSRFGLEFHGGHTRFQQRRDYDAFTGSTLTRISLLTHTDFGAGPSVQIPLGAVFLQTGASAGVAVSTLLRPRSADSNEDELISETDFLLRGGLSLGVPILNRHGLTVGVGIQHVFSNREVALDPVDPLDDPETKKTTPFSTWLEAFVGYQVWF